MDVKVIVSLLTISCLQQETEYRDDYRSISEETVQDIRDAVNSIKDAISQIPEVIYSLKHKIKEITNNNDINEIIDYIREGIQVAVDTIIFLTCFDSKAVRDCIDTEKQAIVQLLVNVIQGFKTCALDAEYEIELLTKAMKELKYRLGLLIENTNSNVRQCVHDHGLQVIQAVMCLTGCLIKIEENPVKSQIFKTIEVANEKLTHVTTELIKCNTKVSTDAIVQRKQIIDELKNCIDNYKTKAPVPETTRPVQTTTSKPEMATQKSGTIPNQEL